MPKLTATRHIHKTLSYLSAEKYAALNNPQPYMRLPFVHVTKRGVNSYWAVPATGDYFGGHKVGRAMAKALLLHLATDTDPLNKHLLRDVMDGLDERLNDAIERHNCRDELVTCWPLEVDSLRGQKAGFLNMIGEMMSATCSVLTDAFNNVSEAELVDYANEHLKGTDEELIKLAEQRKQAQEAALKKARGSYCRGGEV